MNKSVDLSLEQLEDQALVLSQYPKLAHLLAWAESKTNSPNKKYQSETKRLFALILILALARANPTSNQAGLTHSQFQKVDFARLRKFAYEFVNFDDFRQASAFISSFVSAFARDIPRDKALKFSLSFIHEIQNAQILNINLHLLPPILNLSLSPLNFTIITSTYLDIAPELLTFSLEEMQLFLRYFFIYDDLIQFYHHPGNCSALQWKSIQKRMFRPQPLGDLI